MRLLELTLPARDPDELRTFYTETLGLRRPPLAFAAGEPAATHFAFNIPENQLVDAKSWLRERVELLPIPGGGDELHSESWNSDCVYFHDPEGNVVELIARHNLANSSDSPFGAASFLELSEIGLPVPDVSRTCEFLESELEIRLYTDDRDPAFAAVGDEHGLFIVVSEDRPWFPSGDVPRIAPLRVRLAGDEPRELRVPQTPYTIAIASN